MSNPSIDTTSKASSVPPKTRGNRSPGKFATKEGRKPDYGKPDSGGRRTRRRSRQTKKRRRRIKRRQTRKLSRNTKRRRM